MSSARRRRPEAGFALIDAMVSLAILGVVLGLFFEVVQTTLDARRHAAASRRAVLVAQSQLALAETSRSMAASWQDGARLPPMSARCAEPNRSGTRPNTAAIRH